MAREVGAGFGLVGAEVAHHGGNGADGFLVLREEGGVGLLLAEEDGAFVLFGAEGEGEVG